MERKIKGYGWNPDMLDGRDLMYAAPPEVVTQLPTEVDLRSHCPDVYDQGQLGSCTANAIGAALEFDLMKQGESAFTPSRLYIYYNERAIEGTVNSDSGAQIRDGIKSVAALGACPEDMWPYDITKFAERPTDPPCYQTALQHKSVSYARVIQHLSQIQGCL